MRRHRRPALAVFLRSGRGRRKRRLALAAVVSQSKPGRRDGIAILTVSWHARLSPARPSRARRLRGRGRLNTELAFRGAAPAACDGAEPNPPRSLSDLAGRATKVTRFFAVQGRTDSTKAADAGTSFGIGAACLRAPACPGAPLPKRQCAPCRARNLDWAALLDDVPVVGRVIVRWWPEVLRMDHRVSSHPASVVGQPTSSARSLTTTCAPCCRSSSALPFRATPITSPKFPFDPA